MDDNEFDPYEIIMEAEDIIAPGGRCILCRSPFGSRGKDGFITYRAFDGNSDVCTVCVDYASPEKVASRKYDLDQKKRRE